MNGDLDNQAIEGDDAMEMDDDYPDDIPENSIFTEIDNYKKFKSGYLNCKQLHFWDFKNIIPFLGFQKYNPIFEILKI